MFKTIKTILYALIITSLLVMAGGVLASALDVPGGIKLFTVESGSMEPAIKTGSLVVVKQAETYHNQDIITFKAAKDRNVDNPRFTTTHRIIETQESEDGVLFVTQGDANETADPEPVDQELILGKSILIIPYLGYPISLAKTRDGLILLIVIPATLIIYSELINIKNEVSKLLAEKKEKEEKSKNKATKKTTKAKTKKKSAKKTKQDNKLHNTLINKLQAMKTQLTTKLKTIAQKLKLNKLKTTKSKLLFLSISALILQASATGAFFTQTKRVSNSFTAGYWETDNDESNDNASSSSSNNDQADNFNSVNLNNASTDNKSAPNPQEIKKPLSEKEKDDNEKDNNDVSDNLLNQDGVESTENQGDVESDQEELLSDESDEAIDEQDAEPEENDKNDSDQSEDDNTSTDDPSDLDTTDTNDNETQHNDSE